MNRSFYFCLLPVTLVCRAPECPSLSPVSVNLPPSFLIRAFISQHLLPCVLYHLCMLALGSSMGWWGVQGVEFAHRVLLVTRGLCDFVERFFC